MPEGKDNEKKTDAVSMEEHNKIIGVANTTKAENEELKKKIETMQKENKENLETEKKEWEKAKEDTDKQIEDLKKIVEEKKPVTKVAKGIVTEPQPVDNQPDTVLKQIEEQIMPEKLVNPQRFASNIARFQHYASPVTKQFDDEQLGKVVSLHAGVNKTSPDIVGGENNRYARSQSHNDIVFRQKPIN